LTALATRNTGLQSKRDPGRERRERREERERREREREERVLQSQVRRCSRKGSTVTREERKKEIERVREREREMRISKRERDRQKDGGIAMVSSKLFSPFLCSALVCQRCHG